MRPPNPEADKLLNRYFPVLDHGFIALVDYMGNDEAVDEMARVSYGQGTRQKNETRGLLRYLMSHAHTSPFEGVELKFHVALPIFVARQWIRHRTANVNEYSGRYSEMPMTFYEPLDWRIQSQTNKQGSEGHLDPYEAEHLEHSAWDTLAHAKAFYAEALGDNVARELARIHLPLSQYTQWYWKIDLHNLLHFLTLRCDSHAQEEIRVYANLIAAILKEAFPIVFEAWLDYKFQATSFSRMEMQLLMTLLEFGYTLPHMENLNDAEWKVLADSAGLSKRELSYFKEKLLNDNSKSRANEFVLPHSITPEEAHKRLFGP